MSNAPDPSLNVREVVTKVWSFYVEQYQNAEALRAQGKRRITQTQLAEEIGISFPHLNAIFKCIEHGDPLPNVHENTLKAFVAFVKRRKL